MRIEVLFVRDCPHRREAERRVRETLLELARDVPVVPVIVRDLEHAARLGFVGSPTVRVDGRDVVPPGPAAAPALACRIYRTAAGVAGVPDRESIRSAILGGAVK